MNTGSPLAARLNLNIFAVLIVALVIAIVLAALYFLFKKLEEYKLSPEYAAKQKNHATRNSEIQDTAKRANLNKEEKDVLHSIFKKHPLPNIIYAVKDVELMETYLREVFEGFNVINDEDGKAALFRVRSKLAKVFASPQPIKNSRLIPVETEFTYTPSQGIHYKFKLNNLTPEEMLIGIPEELPNDEKPEILSKISLVFIYKKSAPYNLEARVVRYQKDKNNQEVVVCGHTDRIFPLQKRMAPRIEIHMDCEFSSVKVQVTKKGKNESTDYFPSDKMHAGVLEDVSSGGCRIVTDLPIKAEQYMFIRGPLDGQNEHTAIGKILRTTQNKNGKFILHIKYEEIELKLSNRINAIACGYIK